LNNTDINGNTALHFADCKVLKMMIEREGIDLSVVNAEGETPFIIFVKYVANVVEMRQICQYNHLQMVAYLIEKFPSVLSWRHPQTGNNLVHMLVGRNYALLLETVLPYVDGIINDCNLTGKTPLFHALSRKNKRDSIIEILVGNKNLQVNQYCVKGYTALHYACCNFDHNSILKILRSQHDVKIDLNDTRGNSPLHAMLTKLAEGEAKTITDHASTASNIVYLFQHHDKRIQYMKNETGLTIYNMIETVIYSLKKFRLTDTYAGKTFVNLKTTIDYGNQRERWLIYSYLMDDHPERLWKRQKLDRISITIDDINNCNIHFEYKL
jgi:hypothetical protein